jgi:predicted phosphodiesterase
LEFGDWTPERTDAGVVILAGDIHQGSQGIEWARRHFPKQPVIYILGNHEFYGHAVRPLLEQCRAEARRHNVHLLENQSVQIGHLTFLGCTLWTDFKLWPKPAEAMAVAENGMIDFRAIKTNSGQLRPEDTVKWHQASVSWLRAELTRNDPEKTVIITHHAPGEKSIPPRYAGGILNAAFASDLEALIRPSRVPLCIHGHTHHCVDYKIGRTRVFSNQKGYPGETEPAFAANATIDL